MTKPFWTTKTSDPVAPRFSQRPMVRSRRDGLCRLKRSPGWGIDLANVMTKWMGTLVLALTPATAVAASEETNTDALGAASVSREELREGVQRAFGPGPGDADVVDPRVEILEKHDEGDHERWHLRYRVHEDDHAYAYLLLPKPLPEDGERLPLVLCPHPTALIGKDRVIGRYDDPPDSAQEERARRARQYALDLVRRGFIVFAPDRAGFGERRLLSGGENVSRQMSAFQEKLAERWPGWRLTAGKNVWDLQRALDFLTGMDFVDPERVATIGHSLGSWDSLMLAAMDDRVSAVVANAGGMVHFQPELWEDADELREFLAGDGGGLRADVNLFLMLIAPRPLLYNWSLDDPYERGNPNILEGMRTVHAYYQEQYDGTDPYWKPQLSIHFHDRGHDFPGDVRQLAYAWIERQLDFEREN